MRMARSSGGSSRYAPESDEGFCRKLVDDAARDLGGLDILVNNAARQHARKSILDITTKDLDWTFRANLYALFFRSFAASSVKKRERRQLIGALIANRAHMTASATQPIE